MQFTLRDIPAAMRNQGWTIGAQLMDRWFASPSWAMSAPIKRGNAPAPAWAVDTSIVKMHWLLRFARVATAYHHLLQSWSQPPRLEKNAKQVEAQFRRWLALNPRAHSEIYAVNNASFREYRGRFIAEETFLSFPMFTGSQFPVRS